MISLFTIHLFCWGIIQIHENITLMGFELLRTVFSVKKNEKKEKKDQEKYQGLYGRNA